MDSRLRGVKSVVKKEMVSVFCFGFLKNGFPPARE